MTRPCGDVLAMAWGAVYATWAGLKLVDVATPTLCVPNPIAGFAMLAALVELGLGVGVCYRHSRRMASIAGMAFNLGLVAFAFIADARGLPWKGCGCVFVGIELPWLPGHAILAGVLALPFFGIVVHSELQLQRAGRSAT